MLWQPGTFGGVAQPRDHWRRAQTVAAGYHANATHFDGSTVVTRASALSGVVAAKIGILSFWMRVTANEAAFRRIYSQSTNAHFVAQIGSDGILFFQGQDTGDVNRLQITATTPIFIANGWVHALAAWDVASSVATFYLSNASDLASASTSNANIDYVDTQINVGAHNETPILAFTGDIADFYFNYAETLDMTNGTNRAKFISGGKPVSLGADGSTPTGTQPGLYLGNAAATFQTNLGSGGNFTVVGSLTDASTSPSD